MDVRVKNLARDLIKPLKNKGIETRSFNYLKLVFKPKDKCRLFATFPASGANWTDDITGYVLAKTLKGESGITFDDTAPSLKQATTVKYPFISPADARTLKTQTIAQTYPELGIDHMFHTHGHARESGLWWLDQARTGMITRHIPTALFSYASKRRNIYGSFEECMEKTDALNRVIKFYNSWNTYRVKYPARFFYFKYEDCRINPQENFLRYLSFMFDREFDPAVVDEALDFFSFEKQKEREKLFSKDDKQHFHFKGKTSYKDEIDQASYAMILDRLINELDFDFGYDYSSEKTVDETEKESVTA